MELHVLPFGKPAWEKRKELLRGIIAARPGPPYDYRDVLYLVPNDRMVLSLRALFLETLREATGSRACMPPAFRTLNRLVESRAARAAGKPVVDRTTRSLAIEELARDVAHKQTGLRVPPDTLAPSIAPLIADALDRVYTYDVPERTLRALAEDSVSGALLLAVKRSYEAWLARHGLADPAAARAALMPGEGDIEGVRTVVLDGFYDADPVELRVLKTLAKVPDATLILEAPGLCVDGTRAAGMPYFGTDRLFDALGLNMPEGQPTRTDDEADALSGALFGGRLLSVTKRDAARLKPLSTHITVAGAVNASEEAYYVAHTVKEGVLNGSIPDMGGVAVYLPEPDSYMPLIERAFRETGVPYSVNAGVPLVQSPVATALMRMLSLPAGGYSFAGIRAALSSPLIRLGPDGNHPEAFGRFGRLERITRGKRAWLERVRKPGSEESAKYAGLARDPLERLIGLVSALPEGRARLDGWCTAVKGIISGTGMEEAAAELSVTEPGIFAALEGVKDALDALDASAAMLRSTMKLPGFLYILRKTLSAARYTTGGRRFAGVRVLTGLEILTEPFDTMFACGLTEGAVPRSYTPELFLDGASAKADGIPGKPKHDSREARRFLSALMCAHSVHLVHPESGNRGPVPPSPYIRALRPFTRDNTVEKWCRPSDPSHAMSPAEVMRALAMKAALPGGADPDKLVRALGSLPEDTPGLARAKAALGPARPASPPTPPSKSRFSVTELEEYLLCHYRYYHSRVLKSGPVEEPDDDIAPHEAGSLVHEILGRFYEGSKGPVGADNMEAELARLRDIADSMLSKLPDRLPNRVFARRFTEFIAPRFIETEARLAGSGYTPCGFELPVMLAVKDEKHGSFVITGKIDRLELGADGGFVVTDYKTGSYPGSGRPLGELFQLPLYAHMIKENPPEMGEGSKPGRPVGFVYYNLKDGSMRDVVLYEADSAIPGSEIRPRRKTTAESLDESVKEAYDKAVEAVRGILDGRFEPSCTKNRVCERCLYLEVCEQGQSLGDVAEEDTGNGEDAGED